MSNHLRVATFGILALALSAVSVLLPQLLQLSQYFDGGFFTAETYGTMALSAVGALSLGLADPQRSFLWGLTLGVCPCLYGVFLIFVGGGFLLAPLGLVVVASFLPPVVAASLGQLLRGR